MVNGHGGIRPHSGRPRLGAAKEYRDYYWLKEHLARSKTIKAVAQLAGVSSGTISVWMERHGLALPKLPPLTERYDPSVQIWRNKAFLERTTNRSLRDVAAAAGCSHETIRLARIRNEVT